ncbi:paramyosin-like [Limulus polyphemus]|uniref:Paramyosin n=1 Tax=Limulus polyphemus TaxID=6850 RepID=A0ABM1BNC4_LIMPO|nr:paramyosin-like [Limulus polyphemus]
MSFTKTTRNIYRSSSGHGDFSIEHGLDMGALTRLEDKIRLLQDDLDAERELRQRVERERTDLSVQLMQYADRLEEAEGSSESQIEMNKKRDVELSKLRKLLEDTHLESEENAHLLRKKHQEAIADFQDQLDGVQKAKAKIEREKQKFQAEVYELLAEVESANKDKLASLKTVEKLEYSVHELNVRIEELNRSLTEVTSQKSRLSSENIELINEVQEYKVSIENITHIKTQLATQLEDTKRHLEDEERKRSSLEQHVHTVEMELESLKVQIEEESEFRLELERQLAKANGEASTWKSKYETELQSHHEEVEELRRKMIAKTAEYEEQLESLLNKCSSLEKHKSRLQSEVEILVMDLEKATTHAQNLERQVTQLEKVNIDLKSKNEELTVIVEQTQRELRIKIADLQKFQYEYDKLKEVKENLVRENKKLADDLNDVKAHLNDANRRIHEMDLEIKRLESEREELSAAYKEAETLRKQEEARAQRLSAEMTQLKYDFEKRLALKEEEMEALRKQKEIEIEHLSMRLAEAEAKLKTEVARLKKKYQVQITELEMSLDAANKQMLDLQKTIKKQSMQIMELQSHYDETHRQLQQTVDQLGIAQRRCQGLQSELDEIRVTLESEIRTKKSLEQSLEESHTRINELTTINANITSAKSKLETELTALQGDYDSIHKDLRAADDRANRTITELKVTKERLVEQHERYVKIENIKKSLEIEVRNYQIRIEEVEANALAGGKRVIAKLETRIRDVEIELEEEKRRHIETQKILRKKEYRLKEILLQTEEDHRNLILMNEALDKVNEQCKMYKRQLAEQEGMSQQNLTRVRRFQRELEAAEERADQAENNLSFIRAKHRSWVTTSQVPGGMKQVFISEEQTSTRY